MRALSLHLYKKPARTGKTLLATRARVTVAAHGRHVARLEKKTMFAICSSCSRPSFHLEACHRIIQGGHRYAGNLAGVREDLEQLLRYVAIFCRRTIDCSMAGYRISCIETARLQYCLRYSTRIDVTDPLIRAQQRPAIHYPKVKMNHRKKACTIKKNTQHQKLEFYYSG